MKGEKAMNENKSFLKKVKELLENKQVLYSVLIVAGMLVVAILQFIFK